MKNRSLIVMAILAAALVGVAVYTSRDREDSAPEAIGNKVFPDLSVNDVAGVKVSSDKGSLTLQKEEESWVLREKYNYPADFKKIRDALMSLYDLKIGQVMELDDDQRRTMKLVPPSPKSTTEEPKKDGEVKAPSDEEKRESKAGSGTLVAFTDKSGKTLASLIVGAARERKSRAEAGGAFGSFGGGSYPDGQYVTVDGGRNVYLVTKLLDDFGVEAVNWLETEIANVRSSDIMDIEVVGPDRQPVRLAKKDGSKFEMDGLAADEEINTSKMYSIEGAINYLRFKDIADPSLADDKLGFDKAITYRATTKTGEVYTVTIGGSPDGGTDRYVRMRVAMIPRPAQTVEADKDKPKEPAADKKDEDKEEQKKAEEARKQLEEKVGALSKKLSRWTYVIAAYDANQLTVPRSDLVKKKEAKKDEAKPAETQAPESKPTDDKPAAKADAEAPAKGSAAVETATTATQAEAGANSSAKPAGSSEQGQ